MAHEKMYQPGQTSDDIVKSMNSVDRQQAVACIQSLVEDIAARNSDIRVNDLSRQFDHNDDTKAVTGMQGGISGSSKYELEPLTYQTSSQSMIPEEILREITDETKQGILVDNIAFFLCSRKLFLWDTGRTNQGVQIHALY